jgi:hypothetical protein
VQQYPCEKRSHQIFQNYRSASMKRINSKLGFRSTYRDHRRGNEWRFIYLDYENNELTGVSRLIVGRSGGS